MLRLPKFRLEEPTEIGGVTALLEEHGDKAMVVAGGTDLLPNMKHGLFEPEVVVSLAHVADLRGVTDATPDLVNVLVDPRSVLGIVVEAVGLSIDFVDAIGVFLDLWGVRGATPDMVNVLVNPRGVSGVFLDHR